MSSPKASRSLEPFCSSREDLPDLPGAAARGRPPPALAGGAEEEKALEARADLKSLPD